MKYALITLVRNRWLFVHATDGEDGDGGEERRWRR